MGDQLLTFVIYSVVQINVVLVVRRGQGGNERFLVINNFFLSTNEQAPVPESTPRRLECARERLNGLRISVLDEDLSQAQLVQLEEFLDLDINFVLS